MLLVIARVRCQRQAPLGRDAAAHTHRSRRNGQDAARLHVAAEVLTDYADGAFFVDLSPLTDPALVPSAVARALGVGEVPDRPILDVLSAHLSAKELLLVVDNFEQVVDACAALEALLSASPRLRSS